MKKTTILVRDMDCPCEVNMIKMKLASFARISAMDADVAERKFWLIHDEDESEILAAVAELNLNSSHIATDLLVEQDSGSPQNHAQKSQTERKILLWVLGINFAFFLIEMSYGIAANSMGLVADSLDMLSDALVYAMAFFAVYAALGTQKKVAFAAGIFQAGLAGIGFFEVLRRFFGDSYGVDHTLMMAVSAFALIANYACLRLLNQSQSDKPHIKASQIFTSNDIVINLGVIVAGVLVLVFGSNLPDLIVGAAVFVIVIKGAFRIFKLAR